MSQLSHPLQTLHNCNILNVRKQKVYEGFVSPVSLLQHGDAIYIADQIGIIYKMSTPISGKREKEIVLDLRPKLVKLDPDYDERGLLDFVFYRDHIIAFYSGKTHNTLSLFQGDNKTDWKETILFQVRHFKKKFHNGGRLLLDMDSEEACLYLTVGDGGPQKDPYNRAQNPNSYNGKILKFNLPNIDKRIDSRTIKPLSNATNNKIKNKMRAQIAATGVRNPWGISKSRETGIIFFADVGYNSREEINILHTGNRTNSGKNMLPSPPNYGWNIREGTMVTGFYQSTTTTNHQTTLIDPVYEYHTRQFPEIDFFPKSSAVIGGYDIPDLGYIFADWSGVVMVINPINEARPHGKYKLDFIKKLTDSAGKPLKIKAMSTDNANNVFVLASEDTGFRRKTGKIYRLKFTCQE